VPLWSLLRPRGGDRLPRGEVYLALGYLALWAAVGGIVYIAVVVPAHHPGPDVAVLLERAPQLVTQYGALAFDPPHWMSPAASVLVPAVPAYRYRYTFQDEYRFLRRQLAAAALPEGGAVFQVRVRDQAFERDLDCCLDAPRSPLVIAHKSLRFQAMARPPRTP